MYIGVEICSTNSEPCTFKAYLICTTMDLPAKAAVLNVVQFNGFWGCNQKGTWQFFTSFNIATIVTVVCYNIIGCRVESAPGMRGTVQVYPYDEKIHVVQAEIMSILSCMHRKPRHQANLYISTQYCANDHKSLWYILLQLRCMVSRTIMAISHTSLWFDSRDEYSLYALCSVGCL